MAPTKAMILGCAGTALTTEEIRFFEANQPWGLILFARNIGSAEDIKSLTASFREIVGREDAPVFIDQEGGRIQRIREPIAPRYPSGGVLGAIYAQNAAQGRQAAFDMSLLHADDLLPLGINANCLPLLDVPLPDASEVIGDRAYSDTPLAVAEMGRACADGLLSAGVLPVMKHIPGHGRAMLDSHLALPVVDTDLKTLEAVDFLPFQLHADLPMAMTAHVVYAAYDPDQPATLSKTVIDRVIRGFIGFDGLLMTDDLGMHALSGDFASRTKASFAAGCDIVLHCKGDMEEMVPVASATPYLEGKAFERAEKAIELLSKPRARIDMVSVREHFNQLVDTLEPTGVASAERLTLDVDADPTGDGRHGEKIAEHADGSRLAG
ncbi:MAG: beta-N-acetylhexosaminidase [Pseudomonadota bacterium]